MVNCDVTLSRRANFDDTYLLKFTYRDIDTGGLIVPSTPILKLRNPSEAFVDPNSPNSIGEVTVTPIRDDDGSVTGTAGHYYYNIPFDNSTTGIWSAETTYSHEGDTRTANICFIVDAPGATVGGDEVSATEYVYAAPIDIENFILSQVAFEEGGAVDKGVIASYITQAEGEFESRSGTAFKPILVEDEIHDIAAWRQRYPDLFDQYHVAVPRPIKLNHYPILPFNSERAHKIEVYEGREDEATTTDPIRRWSRWDEKGYGRNRDFWFDAEKGEIFVRKTIVFRRASTIRVSYEYGKPIALTTSAIQEDTTFIPCTNTYRYKTRGWIRIGDEYIFHTGKTESGFVGCKRGIYKTTPAVHSNGAEVYEVPDDVRSHIIMRAAALYIQNEVFVSAVGDNAGTAGTFDAKVTEWNERWDSWLENRYQRWSLV